MDEFKIILSCFDDIPNLVKEELLTLYEQINASNNVNEFPVQEPYLSLQSIHFLQNSLLRQPFISSTIIQKLICLWNPKFITTDNILQNLYLKVSFKLLEQIEKSLDSTIKDDALRNFYALLPQIELSNQKIHELNESVTPMLYQMIENNKLDGKFTYLSLLSQRKLQILLKLNELQDLHSIQSNLDFSNHCSVFKYTIVKKEHWILDLTNLYNSHRKNSFLCDTFIRNITLLKLISLTNLETISVHTLDSVTECVNFLLEKYVDDSFVRKYIIDVKRLVTITKFCLENTQKSLNVESVTGVARNNSCLATLARFVDLNNDNYWKKIIVILQENNRLLNEYNLKTDENVDGDWDERIFHGFRILANIFNCIFIMDVKDSAMYYQCVTRILDETKTAILMLNSIEFQIEIIENIFAVLFVRYEYLSEHEELDSMTDAPADTSYTAIDNKTIETLSASSAGNLNALNISFGFIVNNCVLRDILNVLKYCISEIQGKFIQEIKRNESKFNSLQKSRTSLQRIWKCVTDAQWRLQLLTDKTFYQNINTFSNEQVNISCGCAEGSLNKNYCVIDFEEQTDSETEIDKTSECHSAGNKRRKSFRQHLETDKSSEGSETACSTGRSKPKVRNRSDNHEIFKNKSNDLMSYMLASPESLIYICLSQENYDKIDEVIQMFALEESSLASEVKFTENLQFLKTKLRSVFNESQNRSLTSNSSTTQDLSLENLKLVSSSVYDSATVTNLVETFFSTNLIKEHFEYKIIIENYSKLYSFLKNMIDKNEVFMNLFDMAITLGSSKEHSSIFMNMCRRHVNALEPTSDYYKFYETVIQVFHEVNSKHNNLAIINILNTYRYPLNGKQIQKLLAFEKSLLEMTKSFGNSVPSVNTKQTCLNVEHELHNSFLKINKLFLDFQKSGSINNEVNYLTRVFNYLKLLAQLVNYAKIRNITIASYFDILFVSRSDIVGALVFEQNIHPDALEDVFTQLKLNLPYHLIINSVPKIECGLQNIPEIEIHSEISNVLQLTSELKQSCNYENRKCDFKMPSESVLQYVNQQNWILAYLLTGIYPECKIDSIEFVSSRTVRFESLMELHKVYVTKTLFKDNACLTALQHYIQIDVLYSYIYNILSADMYSDNLHDSLEIIDNLPKIQIDSNKNLLRLKDLILFKLAENGNYKYSEYISDLNLRISCVLNNLKYWPGNACIEVLNGLITTHENIDNDKRSELEQWLNKVQIYEDICQCTVFDEWYNVHKESENNPANVLRTLIDLKLVNIALRWIDLFSLQENLSHLFSADFLQQIFESGIYSLKKIKNILDFLPLEQVKEVCEKLLKLLKNLDQLQFIVDHLICLSAKTYRNISVGIKILSCLNASECEQLWCIIDQPLLIIEQLVMNTRLEKLSQILKIISPIIDDSESGKVQTGSDLTLAKVNALLRNYAEKSLEFRVKVQSSDNTTSSGSKSSESKLMLSIDSLSFDIEKSAFVMPELVPDKSQWIGNYEVTECMCCRVTIFSMFNRRHHCRRCGRVICSTCSTKRLKISQYGDIPVRVCIHCYDQTMSQPVGPSRSDRSSTGHSDTDYSGDSWLLTADETHNATVREEFSYEYAPSVSLCLSILKLHSENGNYARFLLQQCNAMMQLLQSTQPGIINNEIDYNMVIQMLRSLLIAAKVGCAKCSLDIELSKCDHLLSQTDLLAMLAANDCLKLLSLCNSITSPSSSSLPPRTSLLTEPLGTKGLRRLRDKLMDNERWDLALDVSTKAGFDKTGVFAAWGKTCLKAGCLYQAREKFEHCLDKVYFQKETQSSSTESPPHESKTEHVIKLRHSESRSSNISVTSGSCRPAKNPPLINEIIDILESTACILDPNVLKNAEVGRLNAETARLNVEATRLNFSADKNFTSLLPKDHALLLLNKLTNLKHIREGNFNSLYPDGHNGNKTPSKHLSRTHSKVPLANVNVHMDQYFYDECLYYLMQYGSHSGITNFYLKHGHLRKALMYLKDNTVENDLYVEIYLACLKNGSVEELQEIMAEIDSTLTTWRTGLLHICRYLDNTGMLRTLYALLLWMQDFVRAAMTCIRFYMAGAASYTDLCANINYLRTAQGHLKRELESDQWVKVQTVRKISSVSQDSQRSLMLKMDSRDIDKHINTIWRQMEVTKFLALCERSGRPTLKLLPDTSYFVDTDNSNISKNKIPTLFGTKIEKIQLAVLVILSGGNIDEGFGIAFRIIQDYQLDACKVYCIVTRQLVLSKRYSDVKKLVLCIRTSGVSKEVMDTMCDEALVLAVRTLSDCDTAASSLSKDEKGYTESLIHLIQDVAVKITAYIECKQLKSAYLLAVRYNRLRDVRRILREAERLNQPYIRNICQKRLAQAPESTNCKTEE